MSGPLMAAEHEEVPTTPTGRRISFWDLNRVYARPLWERIGPSAVWWGHSSFVTGEGTHRSLWRCYHGLVFWECVFEEHPHYPDIWGPEAVILQPRHLIAGPLGQLQKDMTRLEGRIFTTKATAAEREHPVYRCWLPEDDDERPSWEPGEMGDCAFPRPIIWRAAKSLWPRAWKDAPPVSLQDLAIR